MHTKLMVGVMMLAFPSGALAADATTPAAQASNSGVSQTAEQAAASLPPAPQGPFFSRRVAQNQGGFPPMGFDPMSNDVLPSEDSAVAQNTMPPPGPGMMPPRPGNAFGNNLGNGTEVQVEVRGRIGLAGRGAGNGGNGFGNNGFGNFMRGMPYGMPYSQGYGAPYGTPFNHAGTMGQYAPEPAQQAAPGASDAPAPASDQNPAQNTGQYPWNPGAMAPGGMAPGGMAMPNPGGFFAQPQQAPGGNTSPPQPPEEPQWVKDSRAEADKLREQTQQRMAEMQKNNPYAQPYQPYGQGAYGQGYGAPYGAPYGTPYGNPYGGPYGQPFAQPYGYAPQPQASDPTK